MQQKDFAHQDDQCDLSVSIVIPCLNESRTVGLCAEKAGTILRNSGLRGEVIVSDNGSTDNSRLIAEAAGAKVISISQRGYGHALYRGFQEARGRYIFFADADSSYDFTEIPRFVSKLDEGFELVMGCRRPKFGGTIEPGAMPFLHRWIGNPGISFLGRTLFGVPIHDFCCGLRAFRRESIMSLDLRPGGMEFALEMIVKSAMKGFRITELPITLHPDGRLGPSHLRTWRDGWVHLKFLVIYCPKYLFVVPGAVMLSIGGIAFAALSFGTVFVGQIAFDVNTMIVAGALMVIGMQSLIFGVGAKTAASLVGLTRTDAFHRRIKVYNPFELGLLIGLLLAALGILGLIISLDFWANRGFGAISYPIGLRMVVPSVTAMVMGAQIMFGGFFLQLLLSVSSVTNEEKTAD